jgi:hypothetical protein
MKYITCENRTSESKYFKGKFCYEKVLVDDNITKVLCWKCTANSLPMPENKKSSGYPRGWKFMNEFVDSEGNVYHKGEIQENLFGTLPPTEIKKSDKPKKKKQSIDDKIVIEFSKLSKNKSKKKKG